MNAAAVSAPFRILLQTAAAVGLVGGCSLSAATALEPPPALQIPNSQLEPVNWTDLDGWAEDDHLAAFKAFLESCKAIKPQTAGARDGGPMAEALGQICARTSSVSTSEQARSFFETNFRPLRIATLGESAGFLTGYYEPVVEGRRDWSIDYQMPLHRRPSNLVANGRRGMAANFFPNKGLVGRKFGRRKIVPYYDRAEIEEGVLTGRKLEICWLKDPIDVLFIQIQGSARIRLDNGEIVRLNYDGHNGYPYTPIGRFLIERGAIPREEMSMQRIRQWLEANPEEGREVRYKNRSYVFFRETGLSATEEPKGGQGVTLTPGRSIAIDRPLHAYGSLFFIEAELPIASAQPTTKFRRLMIGQDTGSAIVGPARADLYFGAGEEAGKIAGRVRHPGRFAMLVPRALDPAEAAKHVLLPRPKPVMVAQDDDKKIPLPRPRPANLGRAP